MLNNEIRCKEYPNNYCELDIEIEEALIAPIHFFLKVSHIPQMIPFIYNSQFAPTSKLSSLTKDHITDICSPFTKNNVLTLKKSK